MQQVNILLVDDHASNLLALEAVLDELGENLIRASSGEEALGLLATQDFAVVLLDVRMPTMSGFETARHIRADARSARTPIVFLTATQEEEFSAHEAYELGAVDFMTKPLVPAVLRAKVAIFSDLFRRTHESALGERDRAAATIRAKDERLRLILDNTKDYGFVLADVAGTITEWEGGASVVTGWTAQEAVGMPIGMIFTAEDREADVPRAEMARASLAGRAADRRWHVRKDGSRFYADGVMVGLRDVNGRLRGYAKIFRDSTAEHLNEEELEATRLREHNAAAHLRRLASELSEANRRKTEFLAVLAHELRNPLAPIRNGLQILKRDDRAPPEIVQVRDMMERQLSHLVALVDDLMDVARINQGKFNLRLQTMDLAEVVTAAIEASMPLMDKAGHEMALHASRTALWVEGDRTRLTQVFANLLSNAAKFTPAGGRVSVYVRRNDDYAVVVVEDTGIGLSPGSTSSVFDMFSQVAGRHESPPSGLGIGLSLVRSLVALHGGAVNASSPGLGLGCSFEVRLPLALQPADVAAEAAGTERGGEGQQSLRILVVDDNVDAADSMALMLRSQGHDAVVAYDGLTATAMAASWLPEVVLLDIGMPGMNGFEVAAALRRTPGLQDTVLVALTGWGSPDDRDRAQRAGFHHHLVKPAAPMALARLFMELRTPGS